VLSGAVGAFGKVASDRVPKSELNPSLNMVDAIGKLPKAPGVSQAEHEAGIRAFLRKLPNNTRQFAENFLIAIGIDATRLAPSLLEHLAGIGETRIAEALSDTTDEQKQAAKSRGVAL
jgi:hypothetical protein